MSWLVKLGKTDKGIPTQAPRNQSPKPSLSSLLSRLNQNQNRPLNLNCNEFRIKSQQPVQPPLQYNQFSEVIKAEREKKRRNSKTRRNVIFTENNCFARAVAEYKQQQKLKSTVKFETPTVIHEADIEESLDIQETMKQIRVKNQHSGDLEENERAAELEETKNRYQQAEQERNNTIEIGNKPRQSPMNPLQEINQLQVGSPRQHTPSNQGKRTVLKCRVIQTPTKITTGESGFVQL